MRAVMTADQYYRQGITGSNPAVPMASRPEPTEVTDGKMTDGRYWGELAGIYPLSAATADEAAKASAVNFCCSLIAEAIGSLPFDVIDIATGKPAEDFALADLLSYAPNPFQVGAEFWPAMMFTAALRNIAFAEPVAHADGLEMWALDPLRTHVDWKDRGFSVTYQDDNATRVMGPGDLFWITGLADSRLRPLTPWKMARGSIEFALALEHQGRLSAQNINRPGGVLQSDQELGDEAFERLQESMRRWRAGGNAILEQGLKYEVVQTDNSDSQLMELIDQRTMEMARYWRMPRSLITGNSKNSEQESGDFVRWVARPWCRRIEQAVRARLFTPEMRARYKVKVNLDGMLRGDSATQARNAVLYRTAGSHSINDVRVNMHNLPRIDEPWADDVREPLNSNRAADTMSGGETAPQDKDTATND
ncbi:phage portal protein [Sphingobium yanoikuyae]|uniref:Phage portal protein n=1 Tax=Sphingobium yanoikuyae TaxID=13690 RepID=A0A9X7YBT0_SPHYA|nr:phage portal protein [Sphingobium yanoikuyae]QNG44697.1 phage portal protein [Sphingobium yanoikuyae]